MAPAEQFIVRDRSSFTAGCERPPASRSMYPLNRPVTSAVLYPSASSAGRSYRRLLVARARAAGCDHDRGAEDRRGLPDEADRRQPADAVQDRRRHAAPVPEADGPRRPGPPARRVRGHALALRPSSPCAPSTARTPATAPPSGRGWRSDFLDPRNLPGVFWAARLIDPSLTGSKLRTDRDRRDRAQLLSRRAAPGRDPQLRLLRALARPATRRTCARYPRAEQRHRLRGVGDIRGRAGRVRDRRGDDPGDQRRLGVHDLLAPVRVDGQEEGERPRLQADLRQPCLDQGRGAAQVVPRDLQRRGCQPPSTSTTPPTSTSGNRPGRTSSPTQLGNPSSGSRT